MNAMEQVQKLKAEHRAVLARKAAEEQRAKDEAKAASDAGFRAAVAEMIAKRGIEWMAEFGSETQSSERHWRAMAFTFPGHQSIRVDFLPVGGGVWADASVSCSGVWPWYVGGYGFNNLVEALCKAEMPPEEPIPF